MEQEIDIKSFLLENGYPVKDSGGQILSKCLYRGGDGWNLSINKKNGLWFDFVTTEGGGFPSLAARIGADIEKFGAQETKTFSNTNLIDEFVLPKKFDKKILGSLEKNHSYWTARGISESILEKFGGGLANPEIMPKLSGYYATPIMAENGDLGGFSARYTGPEKWKKKQKILGVKKNFLFPLYLNRADILEKRQILLCEGVADLFSCWEAGFTNSITTFGLYLSDKLLSTIIGLNPREIIVCQNFDPINKLGRTPGQEGASRIKKQLLNFFDPGIVRIASPAPWNDWNEILCDESGGKEKITELVGKSI